MKILVIGASHGTGALAVKDALDRGHHVTAFARTPDKLQIQHRNLTKVQGDFHQKKSVQSAVNGHDSVIVTASSSSLRGFKERPTYFSEGTAYVIEAMKETGVRRLVILSALGTGESRPLLPWLVRKLAVDFLLKVPYQDHERQERMVRISGLDWTIVRPARLTDGPAKKRYRKETAIEQVPSSISRADVADFLVESATSGTYIGQAVQLGG